MDRDSHQTLRRERAIQDTRRRLTLLEIETHRIKAELARLEAENEAEWAESLTGELNGTAREATASIFEHDDAETVATAPIAPVAVAAVATPVVTRDERAPARKTAKLRAATTPVAIKADAKSTGAPQPTKRRRKRKAAPAWMVSLGIHAAAFALIAPLTFVMLSNENVPLFASMFAAEESPEEPGVVPVEMVAVDELEIQEAVYEESAAPLTEDLQSDFDPLAADVNHAPAELPGQLNALPLDIGTLMAGGDGGEGRGSGRTSDGRGDIAGEVGRTSFFGTPARANRVVFLVDNSGSMKQGRMETTLFELARSVDALDEKQEFYVVFYSDQAYPMLYPNSVMEPLPATKENKQRLYDWLYTVELCQGGALLKAMEMAHSLGPQVVYILSDGDITGTATMQRLTQTNEHPYSVHTLGMGVAKPQDAQNLAAIAQANRGTFQMVRPTPAAMQSAKQRPIRSNGRGVSWGEGGF
jgi:hypothetical protein